MFFSQSIYGARPPHTEDLHDQNDEIDLKPAMIEMEDASQLLKNGQVAEQRKSCIPIIGSPLPLHFLVPDRDEPRVFNVDKHSGTSHVEDLHAYGFPTPSRAEERQEGQGPRVSVCAAAKATPGRQNDFDCEVAVLNVDDVEKEDGRRWQTMEET